MDAPDSPSTARVIDHWLGGNVHEHAPSARVLYLDIDAENIALGREIVAGVPGVEYTFGDLTGHGTPNGSPSSTCDPDLRQGQVTAARPVRAQGARGE